MDVLLTLSSLHPADGGLPQAVRATCTHLAREGLRLRVVTRRSHVDAPVLEPSHDRVHTTFAIGNTEIGSTWNFWKCLSTHLDDRTPKLIHDQGLWIPLHLVSAIEAKRRGIPYVASTHGMLESWALQHRGKKKAAAWYGYQRWILEQAALLHATAPTEAENLRELGLTAPVAVIPNGVSLPEFWKQEPSGDERRQALFLSRIHPIKGLPMLIDAWAQVRPEGWRLVIAGPDENDHQQEIEAKVREQGLHDVVSFPGPVSDENKWDLYRDSDLFILPTHSENFGVVVAEALASGVPVITTKGAPWQELKAHACGWWVDPETDALAQALAEGAERTDAERLAMGRRGRRLIKENYTWPRVAEQMHAAYQWVLNDTKRPDFIMGSPSRAG